MAQPTITAVNNTAEDITIVDLGSIVIPGSGQLVLSDFFISELRTSQQLHDSVDNGDMFINDGIETLDKMGSLNFLTPVLAIRGAVPEYFEKLRLLPNATNPTYQIDIESGNCRDSTDNFSIHLDSTVTVDLTASGVNGLDTGGEASSQWYAVHLIGDTTESNTAKGLLSLSASPILPSGYDVFRRIGWIRNDASSDLLSFCMVLENSVRKFYWLEDAASTLEVLNNGSATTWTEVDLTNLVPSTALNVYLQTRFSTGTSGNGPDHLEIRTKDATNQGIEIGFGSKSDDKGKMPVQVGTDDAQKIDYTVSNVFNMADLAVLGWDDEV